MAPRRREKLLRAFSLLALQPFQWVLLSLEKGKVKNSIVLTCDSCSPQTVTLTYATAPFVRRVRQSDGANPPFVTWFDGTTHFDSISCA